MAHIDGRIKTPYQFFQHTLQELKTSRHPQCGVIKIFLRNGYPNAP